MSFGRDDDRGGARRPGAGGWPGQGAGQARSDGRPGSGAAQPGTGSRADLNALGGGQPSSSELRRPAAQAPTPVEAPTPTMPAGGGAVRGIAEKFSANPATGTGGMAIPVAVSPGRNGFGPELTVGYDSGAGNGPFGLGWSLSVPSVGRKTDKGLPQYRDDQQSDTFVMSNAEDLVPLLKQSGGSWTPDVVDTAEARFERYRPRVESAFARIERVTVRASRRVYWRTTTKDNVTSIYGQSPQACIADPEHPSRIFRWLLERTEDDRGNVILYQYKAEDRAAVPVKVHEGHRHEGRAPVSANRYLKRILYGNKRDVAHPATPKHFHFEVVLDYGEHAAVTATGGPTPDDTGNWGARADAFSTYRAGFEVRTYRLCRRILMFHRFAALDPTAPSLPAPVLVRSTDFSYEETGAVTYLRSATHTGYERTAEGGYLAQSLPPMAFDYSRATFSTKVEHLDADTSLPRHIDGQSYQWIDLDGEGIPGVLSQHGAGRGAGGALHYQRNLGQGKLGAPQPLPTMPSIARLDAAGATMQLRDVTGSGTSDLVSYGGTARGFHARTPRVGQSGQRAKSDWAPLRYFSELPNVNYADPSLRFIDLTGDGFADIMMSEEHVYRWHPSVRTRGFGEGRTSTRFSDEKKGPTAVFSEAEQTVFLADMSGDGLSDLVRIRNGSVSYWPNLGYGRFGPRVVMGDAPMMAPDNLFSPSRIRLADIDGSGTADLIYIGQDGVHVWENQAGNRFGERVRLAIFPSHDDLSRVDVIDVLGSGTASLVWSTPFQGKPPSVRYVDLLSSEKPHLLTTARNSLGLETTISYVSSTRFYLEDEAAGRPWATRLPFPVHVVARVEHRDHVSRLRFVSTYRYRHGFFDTEEREFRGFGYVEQRDAEHVGEHTGAGHLPLPEEMNRDVANGELPLPPVVTKTWFHTGAWSEHQSLLDAYEAEWFNANDKEPRLAEMALPEGMSAVEIHQAHRALAGTMLRQEVYAETRGLRARNPYVVTQQTFGVRRLQPTGKGPYASFLTVPSETLTLQYERYLSEPRISHELAVRVDALGYVTESATVAYARSGHPDFDEQNKRWVTASASRFFHAVDEAPGPDAWYRHGVPLFSKSWELGSGASPAGAIFTPAEIRTAIATQTEVAFDAVPSPTDKRLLSETRERYWKDDRSAPLAFGEVESKALPYQSYAKALTPAMLSGPLQGRVSASELADAGYEDIDAGTPAAGSWWAKGGVTHYQSLAAFHLVDKLVDVHGHETAVSYDTEFVHVTKVTDALGLEVTADIDYRVLQPEKVTDPNANFTEAGFDALGRVVKTAVRGAKGEGDTLDEPTTRIDYELDRYRLSGLPARVKTEARETHGVATPPAETRWLTSYSYTDGGGNVVLVKVAAEPGRAPELDAEGKPVFLGGELQYDDDTAPRWVGTGRTVLDNKGNPIKQYEPYFSATAEYEDDPSIAHWGVTPILHYDPLGRLIRTDMPDGSFSRTEYAPWLQKSWDGNDTALPGQGWYDRMLAMGSGTPEHDAAVKANAHADSPTVTYFDALGRPFAIRENNRTNAELLITRSKLDISGNTVTLYDPLDRACMTYTHSMLGQVLTSSSIDAGDRRMFQTAAGEPIKRWGELGSTHRASYDALRRPTHVYVDDGSTEQLAQRLVYGETHDSADDNYTRGRLVQHYDQAGVVVTDTYDFKGNVASQTRRLATAYRTRVDWSAAGHDLSSVTDPESALSTASSALETETFEHAFAYDALNRPTSITTPDASVTLPAYNEAGLLEQVATKVRGASAATDIVTGIAYDAHGRRETITYANNTETRYTYDPLSFRLTHFKTTRSTDGKLLQSVAYTYDAVGNIVSTRDSATHDLYFSAPSVPEADADYTYDAVYRLIEATGREHEIGANVQRDETQLDPLGVPHPNDPSGLRRYTQRYTYDLAGNITAFQHIPLTGSGGFTRSHTYESGTNRLATTTLSGGTRTYSHDAHGNMTMPHLSVMDWSPSDAGDADLLRHTEVATGQDVYFVYDASGQRVRKLYEHAGLIEERIYLGGFEVYRKWTGTVLSTATLDDERETIHVADDARRVCMIETLTVDGGSATTTITPRFRFQLDNHLGTACVEVNESGAVISFEEYHPYGTSAYRAMKGGVEVSAKRYRYTGKERDDETGLYLMGARYYAAWLGRWTAADPAGTVDGTNLFAYVRGSPIGLKDPGGTRALTPEEEAAVAVQQMVALQAQAIVAAEKAKIAAVEKLAAEGQANLEKGLGNITDTTAGGNEVSVSGALLGAAKSVATQAGEAQLVIAFPPAGIGYQIYKRAKGAYDSFRKGAGDEGDEISGIGQVLYDETPVADAEAAHDAYVAGDSEGFGGALTSLAQWALGKKSVRSKIKSTAKSGIKKTGEAVGVVRDLATGRKKSLARSKKQRPPPETGPGTEPRYHGPKPTHHVNPAHVPGSGHFNRRKTPQPADAEAVFSKAVPDDPVDPRNWYGTNAAGKIYRFSSANDGTAHFSGMEGAGDGIRNITPYALRRLGR